MAFNVVPTASLNAGSVAISPETVTFVVTYTEPDDIMAPCYGFGDNNILVTGPNGFSQYATFVQIEQWDNLKTTAIYSIASPGAGWMITSKRSSETTPGNRPPGANLEQLPGP